MKNYIQSKLFGISYFVEIFISMVLIFAIVVLTFMMFLNVIDFSSYSKSEDILITFLEQAMTLAIGVEFIKMLCKHSPQTVIEVLLFAIARQMVVGHASSLETLAGVTAIAILFATRKYLFCSFDETERAMYRASQKVKITNMLARVHIPVEDGETLREVVVKKLTEEEKTIAIGACVYYKEFALRIASMNQGTVSRVEVIKSIP